MPWETPRTAGPGWETPRTAGGRAGRCRERRGGGLGDAENSGARALSSRVDELATAQGVFPCGHPRFLPRPARAPHPHRTPSPLPGMAFETFLLCLSRNL